MTHVLIPYDTSAERLCLSQAGRQRQLISSVGDTVVMLAKQLPRLRQLSSGFLQGGDFSSASMIPMTIYPTNPPIMEHQPPLSQ